jgi:hypothetical protein
MLCGYLSISDAARKLTSPHPHPPKNRNKLAAQYYILFVVGSTTCFGLIYWTSFGTHMQRYCNLEVSTIVTNVVVFTLVKLLESGFS